MRIRVSACVLLLVSSFCGAQEWGQNHHSAPAIIVNGMEVNAGPFATILEGLSKAFDPGQDNVRWPLYAYSIGQLGNSFCQEHGEKLSASAAALVGPVSSGLIDRSPRYTGIQITDPSWFIDACMEFMGGQVDYKEILNHYLIGIEGAGENLHGGRLEKFLLHSLSKSHGTAISDSDRCVRQLKSGTLSDISDNVHPEFWWESQIKNEEQNSMKLTWSTATDPTQRTIAEMIGSLNEDEDTEVWKFTPRDPGQFGGNFLISFNKPQGHSSGDSSFTNPSSGDSLFTKSWFTKSWLTKSWLTKSWLTKSWLTKSWLTKSRFTKSRFDGGIEWEGMSGDDYYREGSFDMWYLPPFCGAAADDDWYLVSKYRLGFDRDLGFRAKLVPLKPTDVNVARQFAGQ